MPVKRVVKDREWLKKALGFTDKEIRMTIDEGFPVVYIFEVYPHGGGDDEIRIATFQQVLPDDYLNKRFSNAKIRGQLINNEVCEIDLRSVKNG